jgi:alpha-glucoside transport system substrate-binding protein
MTKKKALWSMLAIFVIFAFVISACGPEATEAPPEPEEPAVEEPAAEEPAAEEPAEEEMEEEMPAMEITAAPGGFLEKALAGEYSGTTVTVDGPFTDPDDQRFFESMEAFEEATGITVNYIGDKEFEARLSIAVDAGDAPDIADFPQPGKAATYSRQGHLVDVSEFIPQDWLEQQYNQSWLDMAMIPGPDGEDITGGVWHRFNGKSLVWYPKAAFEAAGYEIPETWDELLGLTQMIADDGDTAWCIGIESGAATGWAATDWTEEMMLRTTSLENYDAWVEGTLPFSSPEVKNAIETWSEVWFNPDYVFGGTDAIVSTFFGDSPASMFEDPPKCWLHKQGNFITGFFPEGAEAGVDYGFFYFPSVNDEFGKPFLVAGDMMSMFNDRPEVRALMEYFTIPDSAAGWLQNGGALAAHQTATPDLYGVDLEAGIAELVAEATSFRFDGSDLMPGEVGAGSFWTGMTDYVSGLSDLDTALAEIDASWPAGVEGEAQAPTEEGEMHPALEDGKLVIAWIPKALNNPVFEIGKVGAETKAAELTDEGPYEVEIMYVGSVASEMAEQARVMADAVTAGAEAIGVSCNDPTGCIDPINDAIDQGLPVMTWDSDAEDSNRFTYLGVDNYEGGLAAGEMLVNSMGEEGQVALLTGVPGAANLEARIAGFKDYVADYPGIEIVTTAVCNDDINLGVQVVEETMQAYPDLDGWFFVGLWPLFADRGSMPLWEEAAQAGMTTIVFDTLPLELDYLKDGFVQGLVGQKYWGWGYDTVQMIYDNIVNGAEFESFTNSGMDLVDECNVDVMAEMWEKQDFTLELPALCEQ